jgi:hypothetical protein
MPILSTADPSDEGGPADRADRLDQCVVGLDRPAAELAESVLSEWLRSFGTEMDGDDAQALERAIAAFRALHVYRGPAGRA